MHEPFGFILGFTAGVATNLFSWWTLFHYIVPRIEFSSAISKIPDSLGENDRSGFRYRIKLQNGGRRGIIDVELAATLRIAGLTEETNIEIIQIPWSPDREKRAPDGLAKKRFFSLLPFFCPEPLLVSGD